MRILVTGASGFIGSSLVRTLVDAGHEVVALSRGGGAQDAGVERIAWSLGEDLPAARLGGIDGAVHLAHDFGGTDGARRSVDGTLALMETCRAAGARRQLFFSSLSARPDAASTYGLAKLAVERETADRADVVVVRPGLVLGDGGLFGRIRRTVRRTPIMPLPDGGRGTVFVVEIETLCRQTLALLAAKDAAKQYNLFEPQPRTLRALVLDEAARYRRRSWIVPIPSRFLVGVLRAFEAIGVPLPVKADNLVGFLSNQASGRHRPSFVE